MRVVKVLFWLVSFAVTTVSCNSDLAQLSKKELALYGCDQLGVDPQLSRDIYDLFVGYKNDGLTFEQAISVTVQACEQGCTGRTDCITPCHGCIGAIVEAVYYPDKDSLPFTPTPPPAGLSLKLPLPGDRFWLLTTEAGGGDCTSPGAVREGHTGKNYYSLDFDDISSDANGNFRQEYNVPVYAAASGTVADNPAIEGNGNYVVIDHGGGYTTRYLHLRDAPIITPSQTVTQGQQIGIVGTTGRSTGTHLHFGVRFNNDGSQNIPQLQQMRLEGQSFEFYETVCTNGTWIQLYRSTNTK